MQWMSQNARHREYNHAAYTTFIKTCINLCSSEASRPVYFIPDVCFVKRNTHLS